MTTINDIISGKKTLSGEKFLRNEIVTSLIDEGVFVEDMELTNELRNSKGSTVLIQAVNPSAYVEGQIPTGTTASNITGQKYTEKEIKAKKIFTVQSWDYFKVIDSIKKGNTSADILTKKMAVWAKQDLQAKFISIVKGAGTAGGSDIIVDGSADVFNYDMVVEAKRLKRDNMTEEKFILVHSDVLARMRLEDKVATIKDSKLNFITEAYNGISIIVNDNLPVETDGNGNKIYTSVLVNEGAFLFAPWKIDNDEIKDFAVVVNEAGDNGAGIKQFILRQRYLLTPNGFSFTGTTAKPFPSNAELADANNWSLEVASKYSPFYTIKSKA